MLRIWILACALVPLLPGVGPTQEKKAEHSIKISVELKGQLEQGFGALEGDSGYRWALAKTGWSRLSVRVGEKTWELLVPNDKATSERVAKLIGKDVAITGQLEPAPLGTIESDLAGLKGYIIRVATLKAVDAK